MSTTLGTYPLGTEPLAGSILHDPPEVTVLAPTGVISTGGPGVTVQWSY